MEIFSALAEKSQKRDNTQYERFELNRLFYAIDKQYKDNCADVGDILEFEVRDPNKLQYVLEILSSDRFLEKYEYNQLDENRFEIRVKPLNLWS